MSSTVPAAAAAADPESAITAAAISSSSSSCSSSKSASKIITYKVVEEEGDGTERHRASFVKYAAVVRNSDHQGDDDKPVSIREWADALAAAYSAFSGTNKARHPTSYCPSSATETTAVVDNLISTLASSTFDGYYFEMPPVTHETIGRRQMEFVLVNAPLLAKFAQSPNIEAFAKPFRENCPPDDNNNNKKPIPSSSSCAFLSLGKDSVLVAPMPPLNDDEDNIIEANYYGHLAAFVRGAPSRQVKETLSHAAKEYLKRVNAINNNNDDDDKYTDDDEHKAPTTTETSTKPPVVNNDDDNDDNNVVWFSTSGLGVAWLHFRIDPFPKYYTYRPYKTMSDNA